MSSKTSPRRGEEKQLESESASTIGGEIKLFIADLKKSLLGEIQDFTMKFRTFRIETERDIKKIMQHPQPYNKM